MARQSLDYATIRHQQAIARNTARQARQPLNNAHSGGARVVSYAFIACMGLAVATVLAIALGSSITQFAFRLGQVIATGAGV